MAETDQDKKDSQMLVYIIIQNYRILAFLTRFMGFGAWREQYFVKAFPFSVYFKC